MKIGNQHPLSYGVRPSILCRYGGQLLLVFASLSIVPLLFTVSYGKFAIAGNYLAIIVGLSVAGYFLARIPAAKDVQQNEALVLTALLFIVASLVLAVPLQREGVDFVSAWFEAVSGVTTTGLSVFGGVENSGKPFHFSRSWMQWIGGLGVVALGVGFTLRRDVAQRFGAADLNEDNELESTRTHARKVLIVYSIITATGVVLLLPFIPWFDAICHTMAAVSTGGFSTRADSIGAFSVTPQIIIVLLSLICALPLSKYWSPSGKGWQFSLRDPQIWAVLSFSFVISIFIYVVEYAAGEAGYSLLSALVNGISAQTTAGFSNVPIGDLHPASKVAMIVSMAIGGTTGSTAGGVKVLRLVIMFHALYVILVGSMLPKHAVENKISRTFDVSSRARETALCIFALFIMTIIFSWIPFLLMGYDPLDSLFEIVSATATVGLSSGIVSAELPSILKIVLSLDMLLGRVEFVGLLLIVFPVNWLNRRMETS